MWPYCCIVEGNYEGVVTTLRLSVTADYNWTTFREDRTGEGRQITHKGRHCHHRNTRDKCKVANNPGDQLIVMEH